MFPIIQIDGKLLCWLCTLSFKRALAKARQVESDGRLAKKRPSTDKPSQQQMKENHKKQNDSSKQILPEIPEKIARNSGLSIDPNSSDHVIAMTQLKEQIASLQKRLTQKDKELLAKDKHITELKSKNFTSENELRVKMSNSEKFYDSKIDVLNKKVKTLLNEVAQLSKGNRRNNVTAVIAKDSSGSGTDSPNTN